MNESDDAFDAIILIMVLAIFTPIMIYCAIPFFKGDVGGFGVQIEKTALETKSEIVPTERDMTTDDVMLMLVVADRNTPLPKKIRLNTFGAPTEFSIDDNFLENKVLMLQNAKAAMPSTLKVHLELFTGPSGMRFWDVHP